MGKRAKVLLAVAIFLAALAGPAHANDDLDNYKWRIEANWWFSHPYGYFGLQNSNNYFNVNRDFGFGSYNTFTGTIDYHFRHKHHFLLNVTPNNNSRSVTFNRTIVFDGVTYDLGAQGSARIKTLNIAPYYTGIYADLAPARDASGKIRGIRISYPRDFLKQQLEFARANGTLGF